MATDLTYAHIEKPENEVARLVRLPRIRVAQIAMDYLAYGWSVEEMCHQHAHLQPAEAHSAMAYYFDHRDEINAEIEAEMVEAEAARSSSVSPPVVTRLRRSRMN
jgi:uncharacterized protein (DUF433 family)